MERSSQSSWAQPQPGAAAPSDVASLLRYPQAVAQLFLGTCGVADIDSLPLSGREAFELVFGCHGVEIYSRYSGIGMAEIITHLLADAIQRFAATSGNPFRQWKGVRVVECFDEKATARAILADHNPELRAAHVFAGLQGLVSRRLVGIMNGLKATAGDGACASPSHWDEMKELLLELEADEDNPIFRIGRRAHCM